MVDLWHCNVNLTEAQTLNLSSATQKKIGDQPKMVCHTSIMYSKHLLQQRTCHLLNTINIKVDIQVSSWEH